MTDEASRLRGFQASRLRTPGSPSLDAWTPGRLDASSYGRILRVGDDGCDVGTPSGVVRLDSAGRVGDLVSLADGSVVAENRSTVDLDRQDWWRLQRVLPNLVRRAEILTAIRGWFRDRGFLEVETPVLARSPGLEVHLAALETTACGETRYLITSPEYHMKRLLSAGVPRIVYLGRAFRDHERGHEHLTEFTMLEWYRTGEGPDALMADVEALVALATGRERTWTRLTVAEALSRWGRPTDDPDDVIRQLVERVEPEMAKLGAVFLTEWPRALASLARLKPGDPSVSERFEAYVDGVELANGFGELTDASEQRARFEHDLAARRALGLPLYPIDEAFLDALAAGLPPCAGIALGVDRLVMLATGAKHIADVTAFPGDLS